MCASNLTQSRLGRLTAWSGAAAAALTLLGSMLFSASADAALQRPGWFPHQLVPYYQPPRGSPAPEAQGSIYIPARGCDGQGADGGTTLLMRYLKYWYPRGEDWGIYSCRHVAGSSTWSSHAEGRALDFHLDVRDPYDKAHADQIWYFFLRQDTGVGNNFAMARRFGIQEIIWNCRRWTASQGAHYYSTCNNTSDRTRRHEDHIHIAQNPYGAGGHTTAYTGYNLY